MLRPRTILYTSLWSLVGVGLVVALFMQADIDVTVAPIRNPVYVTMSDGTIRNAYDLRLRNKHGEDRPFRLSVSSRARMAWASDFQLSATARAVSWLSRCREAMILA